MRNPILAHLGALLILAALTPSVQAGNDWVRWLRQQVADLPATQAIGAERETALAHNRNLAQPLYNPEMNLGFERATETTRTVSISQALDWSGKARSAGRVAQELDQGARLTAEQARARLTAVAIDALVTFDAAQARLDTARAQEQQLSLFDELVRRREASGDVSRIDALASYLSLAQAQQILAETEADTAAARAQLKRILGLEEPALELPPPRLWQADTPSTAPERFMTTHHELRLAEAALSAAEENTELTRKQRRADPTVGLGVGREGGAALWALTFSVPLPVRNTGRPAYQAALAESEHRRFQLDQVRNEVRARLQARLESYRVRLARWQRWHELAEAAEDQVKSSGTGDLLERAWRQGELTTQAYLQALDQHLQARLAGLALREAMQQAWVEWLFESGQLDDWLNTLAGGNAPAIEG